MTKPANYTQAMTDSIVEAYIAVSSESEAVRNDTVKTLAARYGKSVRSIRAKLSRENVYIAKKPVSKDGTVAVRKDVLAGLLSISSGVVLVSAEKLNKSDLKALIGAFEGLRDEIAALEIED
jgi:hypothetical protein